MREWPIICAYAKKGSWCTPTVHAVHALKNRVFIWENHLRGKLSSESHVVQKRNNINICQAPY